MDEEILKQLMGKIVFFDKKQYHQDEMSWGLEAAKILELREMNKNLGEVVRELRTLINMRMQ